MNQDSNADLQRVNIIGCSGAGKTTLCRDLARRLDIPSVDLDDLNFLPEWNSRSQTEFDALLYPILQSDRWVISGNYRRVQPKIWARADTVIWLDYSLFVVMNQVVRRTARRNLRGELCCNGNRESLRRTFSRESIVLWALQTYARRRREYPVLLAHPSAAHLLILRFRTPRQTRDWLAQIESPAPIC